MSATAFHPKWYRQRVSVWWWLGKRSYAIFVLREISSVFVALFAGVTLWQVRAVGAGPESYARFLDSLRTPAALALHLVAFGFVLFHALTWFHLAPRAMVVRLGGRRVPDAAVVLGNYAGWLAASALVAYFFLRG